MEERNCYLVVEKITVDNNKDEFENMLSIVAEIMDFLLIRHEIEVSNEGMDFLRFVVEEMLAGKATGIVLDMLELTFEEAQNDVNYLDKKGLFTSIEYRENKIDNTSVQNNFVAKADTDFIKQYLKDIYTLEKELYCSKEVKEKIQNVINDLGHPQNIKKPEPIKLSDKISMFLLLFIFYGICVGIVAFIAELLFAIGPIILTIGLLVLFVVDIWLCYESSNNSEVLKKYHYDLAEDKKRVDKERALASSYKKTQNLYIENISSCKKTLDQLYSMNIIFPKYRNFIAISQIYEYFMSGRCTELEGHEGAYNIFESEIRQNIIIMQLNNISNQLEQVKRNQYMIYQALQEANSRLAHIESNTEAIKYNTAVIAENSAICARYAESGGSRYY